MAPQVNFNTEDIKERARKDLLDLLEGIRGKKTLVLEKSLAGLINIFIKFSTLQEYGVDKVFWLENGNVDSSQKSVVFLARGDKVQNPKAIAEQIQRLKSDKEGHNVSIFWTPRRTLVGDKVLENEGVLGDVSISELPVYFVPLENDVLSLELDNSFGDLFLRKNPASIFLTSKALMQIQAQLGLFPRIIGKGDNARKLTDLLLRMRSELAVQKTAAANNAHLNELSPSMSIESLIVIDREVDFGTVLLTQLTYEGLLDEIFDIKSNYAEVDVSIVGNVPNQAAQQPGSQKDASPPVQQGRKRKIQLDSSDQLYDQLRDTNFAIVGPLLNKIARRLESDYESRHGAKSTAELKAFVNKLSGYQAEQHSLKVHTGLTEEIIKHTRSDTFNRTLEIQQNIAAGADASQQHENIEELIARDAPIAIVLRMLCLESVMSGGLKPKDLENFKKQILQAYGYNHMLTLDALGKMQLLQSRNSSGASMLAPAIGGSNSGSRTNYNGARKSLRLIVDEVNESDPDDIAYVYSGYAPLSIRLVQSVLQKRYMLSVTKGNQSGGAATGLSTAATGWRGFEEALTHVRGPTFDEAQRGDERALKARQILNGTGDKKLVFILFLGGITFTEIAALRFIARQEQGMTRPTQSEQSPGRVYG